MSRPFAFLDAFSKQSNISRIQQKLNHRRRISQTVVQSKEPHRPKIPQEFKLYWDISYNNSIAQVTQSWQNLKLISPRTNCEAVKMKQNLFQDS